MVPTHSIQGIKVFLNIGWRYAKPLKRDVKTGYKSKVTNPRELMEQILGQAIQQRIGYEQQKEFAN